MREGRRGDLDHGLIDELHAAGCEERDRVTFSSTRPIWLLDQDPPALAGFYAEWCKTCGAAGWELVE